jgi:hypothetical protein
MHNSLNTAENAEEKHIFSKGFKEFLKKEVDMIHTFRDCYMEHSTVLHMSNYPM